MNARKDNRQRIRARFQELKTLDRATAKRFVLHVGKRFLEATASALTFECFVRDRNGGGVVAARALCMAIWIVLLALLAWNFTVCVIDDKECEPSRRVAAEQLQALAPFFAAAFAGAYTALYARLSSQWRYLAEVYNQIKAAQSTADDPNSQHIIDWKAGFIADAKVLHLSEKPIFASIVQAWSHDPKVVKCLIGEPVTDPAQVKWVSDLLLAADRAVTEEEKRDEGKRLRWIPRKECDDLAASVESRVEAAQSLSSKDAARKAREWEQKAKEAAEEAEKWKKKAEENRG